jgi:hypothetical protein
VVRDYIYWGGGGGSREKNWLMLFREVIAIYSENHTKPINRHWENCSITYC